MTYPNITKYPPISERVPRMLHGADYNPEQWQQYPEVLAEDIRLMKLAKCNVMSVGIFSWVSLEPEEGVFTFEWLDRILDSFAENGIYAFLATPSGARPAWMSQKYPEVLRVGVNRVRNLHGFRHNHCYTSPVYREKVRIMNTKLAERYANHPAVIGWHISNEFGGDCHCDYCQEAFRTWVQDKYGTLDQLNHSWWTTFWSHTVTDWSQVESPAPHGETQVHAMNLDWRRFVTEQTADFIKHEIVPLKAANPDIPVTTNLMEFFEGLNYWKFADLLDVISWDSYPTWHDREGDDSRQAARVAMMHDIIRSIKGGKPWMLMESTPSLTNWQDVSKLKRPGMHLLSSLQAVAHGSDTVQYFQWRKSRGSSEKLHGAVVDHVGHEHTRVFGDVTDVGHALEKLEEVIGTSVPAEAAVIFDWENRWGINDSQGPRNKGVKYEETAEAHYLALWEQGVPVDVIHMDADFSKYKLLVAPMLYMVRSGVGERIQKFVENGGIFVATYWSGIVDEHDLCFLGGFPGPLRKTLGIWSEEIDGLHDHDRNYIIPIEGNELDLQGEYEAVELCDLIHTEGAEVLAKYGTDFYAGRPALTVNRLGQGKAYYIASRNTGLFHSHFYKSLIDEAGLSKALDVQLPHGVNTAIRTDGVHDYIFVMNFTHEPQEITLDGRTYTDMLENLVIADSSVQLGAYAVKVLKTERNN
ncbi:beta-galactosidase [Paenibacillus polymyxa]|uniref:beta-galactosidase n=1 Tax=Paenibacillus polymyxa TaxID=1406 RepID=UPI0004DEEE3F|nr:beta-galactosidase [Paenibacillus polymyxa]KJK30413.1 beta-galactosidase [Paenibacillus polymyxa]MBY7739718.1 beta-galactosidase [Paenibacillus polymyxa]RPE02755.1 beta-galactosidase [Paenibacillus polymyxa]UBS85612.1 beta-galactosidase [Paenibacillus polymyxa]WHX34129.1 beta-galactosidase [Paenibacillus polymyxa]